ncbi:response regulator [Azohydromonas australica]|uniref:response regulator n=1 Tax=Azohydromonas australica TaxID=364039 RepID=UPI000425919C|nr:response regulator [Azohydromonas australica]
MTDAPPQAPAPLHDDPAAERSALRAARLLGGAVAALGGAVLLGWALDIPTLRHVLPGFESMKPNAAAGFVLCGAALLARALPPLRCRHLARALGALVVVLALTALFQDLAGIVLGIDGWLIDLHRVPGEISARMAPLTALCFLLCGSALASGPGWIAPRHARCCALGTGFLCLVALFGYLFGDDALYRLGTYRAMAVHTALGMLGLAAGLLLVTRSRHGEGQLSCLVTTVALAVLLSVGWVVSDRLNSLAESDRRETRRELALHELDGLFFSLVDAEAALHGYIVTDDELRLEMFHRAVLSTQGRMESARRLLESQPEQQQRLAQLAKPIQEELLRMQASAELVRTRGFPGARDSILKLWRDKVHMLAIRQRITELQARQQLLLEQSMAAKEADVWRTRRTLLGGGAFGTLLLLGILALLWRENARRRASEIELQLRRDEAEAASRAKSAFLANMSHEIRTPMNAILGLTHLLQRDGATPQQSARLSKIDGAARHLLSIINDVLDLSKIEAGKLRLEERDFGLGALLEQVRSFIAPSAAAKGLEVEVAVDGAPSWLRGDDTRVRQALLNYAANAVKFTAQGRITLRAQLLEQRGERLLMRFEVEDTGMGIAAQQLPRLFEAFEQADRSTTRQHGGTGLGLAITRRVAALMDGQAGADSAPGRGSLFWFTAWLGRGEPVQAAAPAGVQAEAELRQRHAGARVLLVEDNAINREVALELLRGVGLAVDVAQDGEAALAQLRRERYALVLMDVQMPVLDGLQATRALRAQPALAALPVIAMTANAFEEDRAECLAAGMSDFIGKPVNPQALYAALLKWLPPQEAARSVSPPVAQVETVPVPQAAPSGAPAAAAGASASQDDLLARLAQHPGMDVDGALTRLAGLEHRYGALLRLFASHHGRDGERLAQSLVRQDFNAARLTAHGLKGLAATLGATELAEAAQALEARLREGCMDAEVLRPLVAALEQRLMPLVRLIEQAEAEAPGAEA